MLGEAANRVKSTGCPRSFSVGDLRQMVARVARIRIHAAEGIRVKSTGCPCMFSPFAPLRTHGRTFTIASGRDRQRHEVISQMAD